MGFVYKNKYRIITFERLQLFQRMIYAMLVVQIQNDEESHVELYLRLRSNCE